MLTFENVLEIFQEYLLCDPEEEVLPCKRGYVRLTWNKDSRYCVDGILCRTPEELALIEQKMAQMGTKNREAYLRKMALDGYVVRLELPELKELVSLMRYSSNNLNQLTRRVHETGRIYDADLEDISRRQEALWDGVHQVLTQLAKLS